MEEGATLKLDLSHVLKNAVGTTKRHFFATELLLPCTQATALCLQRRTCVFFRVPASLVEVVEVPPAFPLSKNPFLPLLFLLPPRHLPSSVPPQPREGRGKVTCRNSFFLPSLHSPLTTKIWCVGLSGKRVKKPCLPVCFFDFLIFRSWCIMWRQTKRGEKDLVKPLLQDKI